MTEQAKISPRQVQAYQSLRAVAIDAAATCGAQLGVNLLLEDGSLATIAKLAALFGTGSSNANRIDTTDDLDEGQWNLWFTNRRAQDAVGGILADSANVTLTYVGGTSITADLTDLTDSGVGTLRAITRDGKGRITGTRDATITGTAGHITVANGSAAAGVPTIDLADVAVTAGGTLKKRTFDAKGRLSQESSATTDDLSEGATNLYFTSARVRSTTLTGLSTATATAVTAADSVLVGIGKLQGQATANATAIAGKEPAITAGTTAQYWRGDKSWRDLATDVRAAVLTGLSLTTSAVIAATDTVLGALGKMQAQITENLLPKGYIDGLEMQWVSGTALTVTSGSAYIQGSSKVLRATSAIAKTGLSLTASTWYHVYLYSNAGTPDVEIVTTAPEAAYNGTARNKTGDSSRRYLGSIVTSSSGTIFKIKHTGSLVAYLESVFAAPFTVASGFAAIVPTDISCAGVVPATGNRAQLHTDNNSQQQIVFGNSECDFVLSQSPLQALHLSSSLPPSFTERLLFDLPLDSSQAFQMMYISAPSSTASVRVLAYYYER